MTSPPRLHPYFRVPPHSQHGSYLMYTSCHFSATPPPTAPPSGPATAPRTAMATRAGPAKENAAPDHQRIEGGDDDDDDDDDEDEFSTKISLGNFFYIRILGVDLTTTTTTKRTRRPDPDEGRISIAEPQLLWTEKSTGESLASLRIYFFPEELPDGRASTHGEDEVLAGTQKIVMRLQDVAERIALPNPSKKLSRGKYPNNILAKHPVVITYPRYCRFRAMLKRSQDAQVSETKLSLLSALVGFKLPATQESKRVKLYFCRKTVNHPQLHNHPLARNELAPRFKGRPRKRRRPLEPSNAANVASVSSEDRKRKTLLGSIAAPKKRKSGDVVGSTPPKIFCEKRGCFVYDDGVIEMGSTPTSTRAKEASSHDAESSKAPTPERKDVGDEPGARGAPKDENSAPEGKENAKSVKETEPRVKKDQEPKQDVAQLQLHLQLLMQPPLIEAARAAMVRLCGAVPPEPRVNLTADEEEQRKTFLISLFAFMIHRKTPIDKLLVLGGKQVDLFLVFKYCEGLGGGESITARRLWKQVNKALGGHTGNAPSATRKYYEKILQPYERFLRNVAAMNFDAKPAANRSSCPLKIDEAEASQLLSPPSRIPAFSSTQSSLTVKTEEAGVADVKVGRQRSTSKSPSGIMSAASSCSPVGTSQPTTNGMAPRNSGTATPLINGYFTSTNEDESKEFAHLLQGSREFSKEPNRFSNAEQKRQVYVPSDYKIDCFSDHFSHHPKTPPIPANADIDVVAQAMLLPPQMLVSAGTPYDPFHLTPSMKPMDTPRRPMESPLSRATPRTASPKNAHLSSVLSPSSDYVIKIPKPVGLSRVTTTSLMEPEAPLDLSMKSPEIIEAKTRKFSIPATPPMEEQDEPLNLSRSSSRCSPTNAFGRKSPASFPCGKSYAVNNGKSPTRLAKSPQTGSFSNHYSPRSPVVSQGSSANRQNTIGIKQAGHSSQVHPQPARVPSSSAFSLSIPTPPSSSGPPQFFPMGFPYASMTLGYEGKHLQAASANPLTALSGAGVLPPEIAGVLLSAAHAYMGVPGLAAFAGNPPLGKERTLNTGLMERGHGAKATSDPQHKH